MTKKGDPREAGDRELAPTPEEARLVETRDELLQVARLRLSAALLTGGTWALTGALLLAGALPEGALSSALLGAAVLVVPLSVLLLLASDGAAERAWSRFNQGERAMIRRGEPSPDMLELWEELDARPEVYLAAELSQAVVVVGLLLAAAVPLLPAPLRLLGALAGAFLLLARLRGGRPARAFGVPLPGERPALPRGEDRGEGRRDLATRPRDRFAGWRP